MSLLIRCPSTGCDWTGELREKKVKDNRQTLHIMNCKSI